MAAIGPTPPPPWWTVIKADNRQQGPVPAVLPGPAREGHCLQEASPVRAGGPGIYSHVDEFKQATAECQRQVMGTT